MLDQIRVATSVAVTLEAELSTTGFNENPVNKTLKVTFLVTQSIGKVFNAGFTGSAIFSEDKESGLGFIIIAINTGRVLRSRVRGQEQPQDQPEERKVKVLMSSSLVDALKKKDYRESLVSTYVVPEVLKLLYKEEGKFGDSVIVAD